MAAVGELLLVLALLVSARCEVRARDPEVEVEEQEEWQGDVLGGGGRFTPPRPGATDSNPNRSGNWCAYVKDQLLTSSVECGHEPYVMKYQSPCPSGKPDCLVVMYKLSMRPIYRQTKKLSRALLWRCCPGHGGHNCDDIVSEHHLPTESSPLTGRSGPEITAAQGPESQAHLHLGDASGEQNDDHRLHHLRHLHHHPQQHLQQQPQQHPQLSQHPPHQQPLLQQPQQHPQHPPHQRPLLQQPQQHPQQHPQHPPHQRPLLQQPQQHPQQQLPQHPLPQQQPPQQHPPQQRTPSPELQQVAVPAGDAVDAAVDVAVDVAVDMTVDAAMDATVLPLPEAPHMMALVMSQLQPFLQGFNHSLVQLSLQVGQLSRDVAQLKSSPPGAESAEESELLDARLDEVSEHVRTVRWQVEQQRAEVDNRLHSQHAMLHYNLTNFKTDIDMKLKRHNKMLQVSLQAINATLAELKQDQDWDRDQDRNQDLDQDQVKEMQKDHLSPPTQQLQTPSDTPALWEAIERLNNMVVNNSVKVGDMLEEVEMVSDGVQQLRRHLKDVVRRVNQTARQSQVLFMETGLEVEEAKVVVLRRVEELAANLSQQEQRLQEMDVDVDYVYTALYRRNTSTPCHCQDLSAAVTRLERGVANVTQLATQNRRDLEESSEGGAGPWGGASEWEELQHSLQQVKESISSEQTRTQGLEEEVGQLSIASSLLQEADGRLEAQMKLLSASFASLLKDATRHSEVLERLLEEEVLEFLDWPIHDQEALSIPTLKEQLGLLQEQLGGHQEALNGALNEGREEEPSADQPSLTSSSSLADDLLPVGRRWSVGGVPVREHQLLLRPEARQVGGDGSDLWNLEQTMEAVQSRLLRLEETPCSCPNTSSHKAASPSGLEAQLQEEVTWLKRGLEEHLRVFKNVFSNADVVAAANQPLELDQLWRLLRSSRGKGEGKKKRAGGGEAIERGGGHTRSKREATGVFSQSGGSLLFVGGAPQGTSDGILRFEPSVNRGRAYSGGVFVAPSDGVYLFVLSLDMRPGPAHLLLRRAGAGGRRSVALQQREVKEAGPVSSVALLPLREGEELRLDLRAGQWAESEDNLFVGVLLHHLTT